MTGSELSLTPRAGISPPHPVQAAQPAGHSFFRGPNTAKPPQYIDINTTEDAVNNVLAQGIQQGDQRYQTKTLDRAGLSRGKGQDYMAAQEGRQAAGAAATQASEIRAGDDQTNAQMRADFQKMQAQEGMARGMLGHAQNQAAWSVNFAKQQAAMDQLKSALMRPLTLTSIGPSSPTKQTAQQKIAANKARISAKLQQATRK